MVCAGIWVGWKPSNSVKLGGTDDALALPSTSSNSDPEATLNSADMSSTHLPSIDTKQSRYSSVDPRLGPSPALPTSRARLTTLSLLSAFHNHTDFLLSKMALILSESNPTNTSGSNDGAVVLSPKDVMAFDLGPGSDLDARFIEWLGETRGRKVKVRRGWKDLLGFIFGFP
jgi:hypothetical protein